MQNILSRFLIAGLLPIGEDDDKLKLLESAAIDLDKQVTGTPLLAYRFAMVAMDNRSTITDPVIVMTEQAVLGKWQTIGNKIGSNPVQVYRAVIFRALELAAMKNTALNHAVGLIAQNETSLHSAGKEREVIDILLKTCEENVTQQLAEDWANPISVLLPKLSSKIKKTQLGKDDLATALARAVGPQDKESRALNTPNPHWPNSGKEWSHEFVGRATDAIYTAIQSSSKGFIEEVEGSLREFMRDLVASIERLAIRDAKSELLWIKTSMYSPSAHSSYEDLKSIDFLIHAVLDTSRAVARNAPPSVEFFLRNLIGKLHNKSLQLSEVLSIIGLKLKAMPEGQTMFNDPLPTAGRRPWLDIAIRPDSKSSFELQTGVTDIHEENAAELAVKFYRELQIRKLLTSVR